MNVLKALIAVMAMQLVMTLKGVIPALATVDTQEMDFLALVSSFECSKYPLHSSCIILSDKKSIHNSVTFEEYVEYCTLVPNFNLCSTFLNSKTGYSFVHMDSKGVSVYSLTIHTMLVISWEWVVHSQYFCLNSWSVAKTN